MNKAIYADHSATTFVRQEVLNQMLPFFKENCGNPSSIYELGRQSKKAVEQAREKVAAAIGSNTNEIYFTGSGTEADNWAIIGTALANKHKGNHIITSAIEHHAVLHSCEFLERNGFNVTYIPVDQYGIIDLQRLENSITEQTILISVMWANNEIGSIQPIHQIGQIAAAKKIPFHTDAVQAIGALPINVKEASIDMMSLSGHKFYGPKGVGALYIKTGTKIQNVVHGGAQERGRRAGTENVPAIVGMGAAIELCVKDMDSVNKKLNDMRDYLIRRIQESIPYCRLNGHRTQRLPNNVNFCFEFIEGESLILSLDMKGIAASSGSACTSGSLDPSHVLLAIGLPHEIAHGSLRLSMGIENTMEEMDYIVETLTAVVQKLREMSPLYEEIQRGIKYV